MTYKVTGREDVTVPAGAFHALKIEGQGTWTADLPPNTVIARGRAPNGADVAVATRQGARVASGRYFKTFWYVPEVRRWVKSEEDIFASNGMRTEHVTQDLEAFALATASDALAVEPDPPSRPKSRKVRHHAPSPRPAPTAPPLGLQETALPPSPLRPSSTGDGA